jgi:hypothetical protein
MNALRRAAAPLHYGRVPRVCSALSHPPSGVGVRAFWQQAAVRPGPRRRPRPRAEQASFESPSHLCLKARLAAPHHRRAFQQLAQQGEKSPLRSTTTPTTKENSSVVSNAEQRRRDWAIVRRLAIHIWPKDDWATRGRVVLGVGLLVCGKVRSLRQSIHATYRQGEMIMYIRCSY